MPTTVSSGASAHCPAHFYDPLGLGHARHIAQQQRIHRAEYRGVDADADRDGEGCDPREEGSLAEITQRTADLLDEHFHCGDSWANDWG